MVKRWQIADYATCGALILVAIAAGWALAAAGHVSGAAALTFAPLVRPISTPNVPSPAPDAPSFAPAIGPLRTLIAATPAATSVAERPTARPIRATAALQPAVAQPTQLPVTTQPSSAATPASPAASMRAFSPRVIDKPTDAAVRCGSEFASTIWGVVKDQDGHGIAGAVVQVTSRDGRNRFVGRTNRRGGFSIPGLGCTTWIVRLARIPSAPAGIEARTIAVSLNGGRYSGAAVDFLEQ